MTLDQQSKAVYLITFKINDNPHMILSSQKKAEKYCDENRGYVWEAWNVS